MKFDFLPAKYINAINNINADKLSELRLRVGYNVICKYDFKKVYLSENGVTLFDNLAFKCTEQDVKEIINNVTEFSIYAHNDKIKQGFLTTQNGLRIGIAGECVFDKNEIITIKNISSLNIRIAKEIEGCSNKLLPLIINGNKIISSLIISPPAFGKTTILKDLANHLNKMGCYSILILDERGEFFNIRGENIDVISFSDKLFGFNYGIRTLSPDVVITDELSTENDWKCALNAVNSGVKILSSCHGSSVKDLINKNGFEKGVFDRYFVLDSSSGIPGILKNVSDGNMVQI